MAAFDATMFKIVREEFPVLTDSEFNVVILYSLGATLDEIVELEKISKGMVKKRLTSSKSKLHLESVHSIRLVINIKFYAIILSNIL